MSKSPTRGRSAADGDASTETLRLRAADGHEFQATLYRAAAKRAPVLIFWSALGTRARFYANFAKAMTEQGVHVCTPDWRGIGSSSLRASRSVDFGYRELIELDAPEVVDAIGKRYPKTPLWLGGHSLGGQLSALIASSRPGEVAGLVAIASGSVYFRTFPPTFQLAILALTAMAPPLATSLGYFPGERVGFGGREARGVMRDWINVARNGRYAVKGSKVDYEARLGKLQKPVLALSFAGDSWAPEASAGYLMSKMPKCRVTHWNWSTADTQGTQLDHFSWAKQPAQVAPRLAEWLAQNTASGRSG
jgi:predicted alpha/beta hydrolase